MIEFLTACIIIVVGVPCALILVGLGLWLLFWLVIALAFIVPWVWLWVGLLAVPTDWEMVRQGVGILCLVCSGTYLYHLGRDQIRRAPW